MTGSVTISTPDQSTRTRRISALKAPSHRRGDWGIHRVWAVASAAYPSAKTT